ncbi:MAG: hypothetical protein R2856_32430 [Caldilineaceae bacterium]
MHLILRNAARRRSRGHRHLEDGKITAIEAQIAATAAAEIDSQAGLG